ncbi:MAG: SPOR domain-containing protein [Sulfuricellaceae bacterium]
MAHDYKRNERTPPSSAKKDGHPMLAGILIGLFVGLAAAIGVAIYVNKAPTPFTAKPKQPESVQAQQPAVNSGVAPVAPNAAAKPDAATASPDAQGAEKTAKPAEKQRFEFYDILQGKEAPATEQEIKASAAQKPGVNKPKVSYFLQAGSFQTEAEADNLKAKLALLGVEAVIQTATIPDKGVWHRVRVGPYTDIEELNKTRSALSNTGIQAGLIKINE